MRSYLRQGDVGCTTFLRMAYVVLLVFFVGEIFGLAAGGGTFGAFGPGGIDLMELVEEDATTVAVIAGMISAWTLAVLAGAVRIFHRRHAATLMRGERGWRWRRLAAWTLGGAVLMLLAAWGLSGVDVIDADDVFDELFGGAVVVAGIALFVDALASETLRGYFLQSVAARLRHTWAGVAAAPLAALAPGFVAVGVVLSSENLLLAGLVPFAAAYLTVAVALPAVFTVVDDGIERAVAVGTTARVAVLLAAIGDLTALVAGAYALTAAALVGVAIVARIEGWQLADVYRPFTTAGDPPGLAGSTDEERVCHNCGTTITAQYCPECGQRHRPGEPSIRQLVGRLISEVLEVDSRIVRTVRLLFFAPGELTRQYIAGRREHFVRPIRLYLFSSFLFFVLFAIAIPGDELIDPDEQPQGVPADTVEISAELYRQLHAAKQSADTSSAAADLLADSLAAATAAASAAPGDEIPESIPARDATEDAEKRNAEADDVEDDDVEDDDAETSDDGVVRVTPVREASEGRETLRVLLQNGARVVFLLVPVFALILQFLFLHEPYAHHVIFSLHLHAFAFALLSIDMTMRAAGVPLDVLIGVNVAIYTSIAVYLVAAVRRTYDTGWLRALGHTFLILNLYFFAVLFVFGLAAGLVQQILRGGSILPF